MYKHFYELRSSRKYSGGSKGGAQGATPPPPPPLFWVKGVRGKKNPFCGGGMDIFWNYTLFSVNSVQD